VIAGPRTSHSALATVAWGVFCACSWTWCIGMFLPRIMIDRYGLAGFLVFAVPNVLGCAGFGYVLGSPARSEAMARRHAGAIAAFSVVAIAFHMFFVAMLFDRFVLPAESPAWIPLTAALAVFVAGRVLAEVGDRAWLVLAGLVYALSLIAFGATGLDAWPRLREVGIRDAGELAWLAPVITIGFLLCPFLDATFHRALQRGGRHAFGVFGVTFTVMIVFTCFLWFAPSPALLGIGLAHIVAQSTFTVGAHLRELSESPALASRARQRELMLLPLAAAPLLLVARMFVTDDGGLGTALYIRFLVFYSLVFPAYVLAFIGPWRPAATATANLFRCGFVILLLAPLFELGFLHNRATLFVIPLLVLVAWGIMRARARHTEETS
jgi:hypothetical protein